MASFKVGKNHVVYSTQSLAIASRIEECLQKGLLCSTVE